MSGFQEIYETYSKPVYRFLLSITKNETMAEDLLQETFYRALLHIDQFEGKSSLYTWLCRIGKNAWLKECRKSRAYKTVFVDGQENLASDEPSPFFIKNQSRGRGLPITGHNNKLYRRYQNEAVM